MVVGAGRLRGPLWWGKGEGNLHRGHHFTTKDKTRHFKQQIIYGRIVFYFHCFIPLKSPSGWYPLLLLLFCSSCLFISIFITLFLRLSLILRGQEAERGSTRAAVNPAC